MKKQWIAASFLLAALLAFANSAFAQEAEAKKENPWYVGLSFGNATLQGSDQCGAILRIDPSVSCTSDEKDTALKLFGGYKLSDILSVEGGWVDLGSALVPYYDSTAAKVAYYTTDSSGFNLVGRANITGMKDGSLVLFAKAGVFIFDHTRSTGYKDRGADLTYGGGVEYKIAKNLAIRGELEGFALDEEDRSEKDITLLSAGLILSF